MLDIVETHRLVLTSSFCFFTKMDLISRTVKKSRKSVDSNKDYWLRPTHLLLNSPLSENSSKDLDLMYMLPAMEELEPTRDKTRTKAETLYPRRSLSK